MGSLSFSEIVVIVLVILVVFGPRRLPDLARRAGELMAKVRNASSALTESLGTDYEATIEPIKSAKRDFDGIKSDLTKAVTSLGTEITSKTPDTIDAGEDAAADPDATSGSDETADPS